MKETCGGDKWAAGARVALEPLSVERPNGLAARAHPWETGCYRNRGLRSATRRVRADPTPIATCLNRPGVGAKWRYYPPFVNARRLWPSSSFGYRPYGRRPAQCGISGAHPNLPRYDTIHRDWPFRPNRFTKHLPLSQFQTDPNPKLV